MQRNTLAATRKEASKSARGEPESPVEDEVGVATTRDGRGLQGGRVWSGQDSWQRRALLGSLQRVKKTDSFLW